MPVCRLQSFFLCTYLARELMSLFDMACSRASACHRRHPLSHPPPLPCLPAQPAALPADSNRMEVLELGKGPPVLCTVTTEE